MPKMTAESGDEILEFRRRSGSRLCVNRRRSTLPRGARRWELGGTSRLLDVPGSDGAGSPAERGKAIGVPGTGVHWELGCEVEEGEGDLEGGTFAESHEVAPGTRAFS